MANMDRTLQEVLDSGVMAAIPEKSLVVEVANGKMSIGLFLTCGDFIMVSVPEEDYSITLNDINADYVIKQLFSQNKRVKYNMTYRKK